jgi:O-antigen/teichoic acid export membrane protein
VASYVVSYVARGVLSGLADFGHLGGLMLAESVTRLVVAGALVLVGLRSAGTFAAAIALAPLLSTLLVTGGLSRLRLAPGAPVSRRDALEKMGWLVGGAFLAQFLANAGPLFVQLIAPEGRTTEAGVFLGALVIARLALYLLQAMQATLLPNLAALLAEGREREFGTELRRLVVACSALVVVSTLGALLLGPWAVRLVFGDGFDVDAATMGILACATAVHVLAATLGGALIAASRHRLNTMAWLAGSVAFVLVVAVVDDLYRRVELGYLVGACVAASVLLVAARQLGRASTR